MPSVTIPQALELAIQHHEAGRLGEAEAIYRQILAVQPDHAEVHHLLGVIAHHGGREDVAAELIRRAIDLGFESAAAYSNLGEAYRGLGQFEEAVAAYRCALQLNPDLAAAHYNLGVAMKEVGRLEDAAAAFRHTVQLHPGQAEAHSNLGACLAEQGRLEEAVAAYRHALRLDPNLADAYFNLGVALSRQGRFADATLAYRRVTEMSPGFVEGYHNLGAALAEVGESEAAIGAMRRVIELEPGHARAHYNLGNVLQAQGRLDAAVGEYRRAIELNSDYAAAYTNLANARRAQGRLEEAVALFRRALECRGVEAAVQSNLITTLHYLPDAGHDVIAAAQEEWNRRFGDPVKQLVPPHANDRNSERRLRIGYVSADFRDHTMGRNLLPLFRHHDRQGFEIICYSGATKPDALTAEFQRRADRWRGTVGVSDPALAEMIRQDEVDILVDLALHSGGNRLLTFAREPAPVQVSFAGYPGTTGLSGIGYHVSDRFLESGAEARSGPAWESVCLIESFWCYDPCGMELSVNDLPARKTGRLTFGSLNNFCKINGPVLKLWARVLREVADSRLLMLSPEGGHRQQVLATLGGQGVCEERVQFVTQQPRQEYLELYHQVDLMLDPFPYNGHTTSLDALWMGVPVVSLAGEQIVSRAGLSQLSNLGLPELVAFSEDDYVKIAVKLAHDLPRLAELRAMLRARMEGSVLMDGACFAQGIERAYRTLWRRWCAGESSALSKGGDSPTKAASHAP